ncbi:MAG: hypothetical protein V1838_01130 [Patescibacteria group bacterium]
MFGHIPTIDSSSEFSIKEFLLTTPTNKCYRVNNICGLEVDIISDLSTQLLDQSRLSMLRSSLYCKILIPFLCDPCVAIFPGFDDILLNTAALIIKNLYRPQQKIILVEWQDTDIQKLSDHFKWKTDNWPDWLLHCNMENVIPIAEHQFNLR